MSFLVFVVSVALVLILPSPFLIFGGLVLGPHPRFPCVAAASVNLTSPRFKV
jgi:hypothetical protein